MNIRELKEEERQKLDELNTAVDKAIATRRTWLDAKMPEFSRFQVGDDLYNLRSGVLLGKVSSLYRLLRDESKGVMDSSPYCHLRFEVSPDCFDNTSRQPDLLIGSREDAIKFAEQQAETLRR